MKWEHVKPYLLYRCNGMKRSGATRLKYPIGECLKHFQRKLIAMNGLYRQVWFVGPMPLSGPHRSSRPLCPYVQPKLSGDGLIKWRRSVQQRTYIQRSFAESSPSPIYLLIKIDLCVFIPPESVRYPYQAEGKYCKFCLQTNANCGLSIIVLTPGTQHKPPNRNSGANFFFNKNNCSYSSAKMKIVQ